MSDETKSFLAGFFTATVIWIVIVALYLLSK